MAKYIIDIPDEAIDFMGGRDHFSMFVEPVFKTGDCKRYALRLSKEDIEHYTEPDRKAIEDEVWEFVREIYKDDGLTGKDLQECFGYDLFTTAIMDLSYQEMKSKYDAWKAESEQIRVGDEVEYPPNKAKGIVIKCHVPDVYADVDKYAVFTVTSVEYLPIEWLTKTGRVFPEVVELLKKMREEE